MVVDRKPFFSGNVIAKRGSGAMTIFLPLYLFSVLQLFIMGGSHKGKVCDLPRIILIRYFKSLVSLTFMTICTGTGRSY